LNMLEFSGRLGMEWSGQPYHPFREREPVPVAAEIKQAPAAGGIQQRA
jgi:hypothetical protein